MTFIKSSANTTPIVDTVFAIVDLANKDKAKNGPDAIVDATIGSLYSEDGKIVAYDSVFDHYDAIPHANKARYAQSFRGNKEYCSNVYTWVTQGKNIPLAHDVIATPGGTGAVSLAITTCLDRGETIILPEIAWGSYQLMAGENGIKVVTYENFDGDHFNLESVKKAIEQVQAVQDKVVLIINDPCHNPTGYSLTKEEWHAFIAYLNEASKKTPIVIIDDIAYIDYSNHLSTSRNYMEEFANISDNIMIGVAFSCSKTLTSYGMRCGALVLFAQKEEDVEETMIVMEKAARAIWSNINNSVMENFVWVLNENNEAFMKEKQQYIDIMKKRSDVFLSEAKEVGLEVYPYVEGFFVTLKVDDQKEAEKIHAAFMEHHIYTVLVRKGIRVAVCSIPVNKATGLAKKMKDIMNELSKKSA